MGNMVKISKSSSREVKEFAKREWAKANIEHYGKQVDYNQKDFVFKATEDGNIVGSVKGRHEAGVVYIDYLIVAADKKGRGIGRQLMEKTESWGKNLGAGKVHLITGKSWSAVKFYEALGYKQIAVLPKHHFKEDFLVYEKFI
jgi:GNAT superfamily N-acetyltransferase